MFHKVRQLFFASKSGGYFVAVKREGIFHYSVEGGWRDFLSLSIKSTLSVILVRICSVLVKMELSYDQEMRATHGRYHLFRQMQLFGLLQDAKMGLYAHMESIVFMCQPISEFPGKL